MNIFGNEKHYLAYTFSHPEEGLRGSIRYFFFKYQDLLNPNPKPLALTLMYLFLTSLDVDHHGDT